MHSTRHALPVALEDIEPNHWVAWLLDMPGCFGTASTRDEALRRVPEAVEQYGEWRARHGRPWPRLSNGPADVRVVEEFRSIEAGGGYLVNAFFEADREPLSQSDIEEGLWLLGCTRRDLLDTLAGLTPERLWAPLPGQQHGSIAGIVQHVGGAEWWYLNRLHLGQPRAEIPDDPYERLKIVRSHTAAALSALVGDERIVERDGELWSARKVVRRAVWHERDHTRHIAQLIGAPA
jgi:predicted RNase H-like HicB family nuclease